MAEVISLQQVRKMRSRSLKRRIRKHWLHLLMILPVLVWFLIFRYGPLYGIVIAFQDFKMRYGIEGSPFVGLKHFQELFTNAEFPRVFRNTLVLALLNFGLGFPAPIILALMLNELKAQRFKKISQTISYLPHFVSWIVLTGIFMEVLSPSHGPLNAIIKLFGGEPIFFLGDKRYIRGTLVVTNIWKSVGWGSIVYLAALSSVNEELYDAARVDGCGPFKRIWHVTLPGIVPVITIMLILGVGNILGDNFDQNLNLLQLDKFGKSGYYNLDALEVGDVLSTFVYRRSIREGDFSFPQAVDLSRNVIQLILVLGTNAISKRINEYGLW